MELRLISQQITPAYPSFMQANFNFLLKRFPNDPSFYIIIDGHFRSKLNKLFVRTHIFPNVNNEMKPIFFSPNPDYKKSL